MNLNKDAIRLLDRLYKDLYLDEQVLHHATGNKYDKFNNIASYLNKLESTHNKISTSDKHIEYLKKCYYDKYVIKKEEIPEGYYKNQEQMALDRGFGHINIDAEQKAQLQNEVIENQKRSLDTWIDYFLSDDAKVYPFWTKYWAFQGMLNLGYFDKEKSKFYKRTKNTVYPFCDLNREALSISIDLLIKSLNKEIIEDKDLEILVKSGSFQKIYTYILTKILSDNKNIAKRNIGKWVKYDQGSDHMILVNSLQGYNTGWCTAGESTAQTQLQNGDFYVYYTLDDNDEYKVPRIAIRMEYGFIGEIRGVAQNQNIEPDMEVVVEEKIKYFPDKDLYYKKVNDMKLLTEIYNKSLNNLVLTKEELIFLYEINDKIDGFGYAKDPRINEIIKSRFKRCDLAYIFNCNEEQIAFDTYKLNNTDIIYYDGDIFLPKHNIYFIKILPKYINGFLHVSEPENYKNLILPERVNKDLILEDLTNIKDSKLPEYIGGTLYINRLKNAKGLVLPKYVKSLKFASLIDADGLFLPKRIDGDLVLPKLKNIENLSLPKYIGGELVLFALESVKDIIFPEFVGELTLKKLQSVINVKFPNCISNNLFLPYVTYIENSKLPEHVGKNMYMNNIEEIKDLVLPRQIGQFLFLNNVKKAVNVVLPECVNEAIFLQCLEYAENLVLPQKSGDNLCFPNLESPEGLIFPEELTYNIYLKELEITPENVDEYRSKQKTYKK